MGKEKFPVTFGTVVSTAAQDELTRNRLNDLRKHLGLPHFSDIVRFCISDVHKKLVGDDKK